MGLKIGRDLGALKPRKLELRLGQGGATYEASFLLEYELVPGLPKCQKHQDVSFQLGRIGGDFR